MWIDLTKFFLYCERLHSDNEVVEKLVFLFIWKYSVKSIYIVRKTNSTNQLVLRNFCDFRTAALQVAHCENYGTSLSHSFDKFSWKQWYYQRVVDFTEYFFGEREFLILPHCTAQCEKTRYSPCTHWKIFREISSLLNHLVKPPVNWFHEIFVKKVQERISVISTVYSSEKWKI